MTKIPCLAVGVLAASLLTTLSLRAQSPEELLAQAADRPVARSAVKSDGSRFTTSAARFADVKRDIRVPRTAAKRDDHEPFADVGMPFWLRLSSAAAEEASLRQVPEVGLPPLKSQRDLETLFKGIADRYGQADHATVLAEVGHAAVEGLAFRQPPKWTIDDDKRAAALNWTSTTIRTILDSEPAANLPAVARSASTERPYALTAFFRQFRWATVEALRTADQPGFKLEELDLFAEDTAASAVLPGLMQVLSVQRPAYRQELVRQLRTQTADDDPATAALVRLALFDADPEVRREAVQALHTQPAGKVGQLLLEAYRYPWHIIAERATEAIIELDRVDLLPALAEMLSDPDPTAPFSPAADKKQLAVREVVKLNHNRNCLACHAPVGRSTSSRDPIGLQIRVPAPDQALPPISSRAYYNSGVGGVPAIRANHIYLRQDFSRMDRVEAPGEWPEMQRFDYLVRTRTITPAEARAWTPAAEERGAPSMTHRAVLVALTRLTSIYAGNEPDLWQALFRDQPAAKRRVR